MKKKLYDSLAKDLFTKKKLKGKTKRYSVNYTTLWHYESVVKAKSKKEAIAKVKEVTEINDQDITAVWGVKN